MKALKTLAHFAHEFVWMIGLIAIISYSQGRCMGAPRDFGDFCRRVPLAVLYPAFQQGLKASRGVPALEDSDAKRAGSPHFLSPVMTPKEVLNKWVAAFNVRDAKAAASLYHEHATNLQVAVGQPVQGRQAIHDDLVAFFTAFPDSYTRVEQILEEGEWAIIEWSGGRDVFRSVRGTRPDWKIVHAARVRLFPGHCRQDPLTARLLGQGHVVRADWIAAGAVRQTCAMERGQVTRCHRENAKTACHHPIPAYSSRSRFFRGH